MAYHQEQTHEREVEEGEQSSGLQRHNEMMEMHDGIQSEHEIQFENHKLRQELSRKGLRIVDKIMEEQQLTEGDYVEMCNIFKKLYS